MMNYKILLLAVALVFIAAPCNRQGSSPTPPATQNSGQNQNKNNSTLSVVKPSTQGSTPSQGKNNPAPTSRPQPTTIEIMMTDSGFVPGSVRIKQGTAVIFKNTGSQPHWPASNPHPIHTDYPGFDALQGVSTGQSYSFKFDRIGTFGFHDHLNPSSGGAITVTQ